jgi:adhesin transport system membrane fusion protein
MPSRHDFETLEADWRVEVTKGPARAAMIFIIVIALGFAGALYWAYTASLEEVVSGTGKVVSSQQNQVVQHLEGGIVSELLVREGDRVETADVLMRIKDISFSSEFREIEAQKLVIEAQMVRLRAQLEETLPEFPPDLLQAAPDVVARELDLYHTQMAQEEAGLDILRSQVAQREKELADLRQRTRNLNISLGFVSEELALTEPLVAEGVVSRVDLLRLKQRKNELEGAVSSSRHDTVVRSEAAEEARQRANERIELFRSQVLQQLSDAEVRHKIAIESLLQFEERIERTDVRSPVDGIVKRLSVSTIGGVVSPGQALVEIVPTKESLLVEARISPTDIAFVHPRQEVKINLTAYDFAVYGSLSGRVVQISADTTEDDRGVPSYRVLVRTDKPFLDDQGEKLSIIPGMVAEVNILTGEKTVLEYLVQPVLRVAKNALHER